MTTPWISSAVPLTQIAIANSSVGASYALGGTFTSAVEVMYIMSTFNQPVQLSFDGVNDHIAVAAGSSTPVFLTFNFKTNNMFFTRPAVFIKEIGSAPNAGSLYVSAFSAVYT